MAYRERFLKSFRTFKLPKKKKKNIVEDTRNLTFCTYNAIRFGVNHFVKLGNVEMNTTGKPGIV